MRLLIVGLNFAPEPVGVGKYTAEVAAWFAARGHDIFVVTAPPYYPWWRRAPGYVAWRWYREFWQQCRVTRCPLYVPSRVSGWRRILHLISFAITSGPTVLVQALKHRPDIVCCVMPTIFAAPLGLLAARLIGARAWLHVQDFEIDVGRELGIIGFRSISSVALAFEHKLIRCFDLVSTISTAMLHEIERHGVARERLALFYNWVDTKLIFPLASSARMRRELGIPEDRCVVLYAGSMGEKQGLDVVIAAARSLAGDSTSPLFILAGDGHNRRRLEIEARMLQNVMFLPLQPADRFNEFLNIGDIHLLPQHPSVADLVLPSKLGAILAVGKPIIATVAQGSQIARMIGAAGIVVRPSDPTALATAICNLASNPARARMMGKVAVHRARTMFDREKVLTALEKRVCEPAGLRFGSRRGAPRCMSNSDLKNRSTTIDEGPRCNQR